MHTASERALEAHEAIGLLASVVMVVKRLTVARTDNDNSIALAVAVERVNVVVVVVAVDCSNDELKA